MTTHSLLTENPTMFIDGEDIAQFNLCLESRPEIPSPKRKQTVNESNYSDRGSYRNNTGWEDLQVNVTFNYLEDIDKVGRSFRMVFSELRAMLFNATNIQFNDEVDVYYKVKNVEIGNAQNDLIDFGRFTVTFTCNPFAYMGSEGDNISLYFTTDNSNSVSFVINNGSFYESFPKITARITDSTAQSPYVEMYELNRWGNPITPNNPQWKFRITTTGMAIGTKYVIDSDNALMYMQLPDGTLYPISRQIDMLDFPAMKPQTEYQFRINALLFNTRFYLDIERNQVI